MSSSLSSSPLGKATAYPSQYDASLLFTIDRAANRAQLTIPKEWHGQDIWTAYEISWLNRQGKPMVAIGEFRIPWDSPKIVESKSLKLYLNSFNDSSFESIKQVKQHIQTDLSAAVDAHVDVQLFQLQPYSGPLIHDLEGENIDDLEVEIEHYSPEPTLLRCEEDAPVVFECLYSDLLKSNCPETSQPDWGSIQIAYTGPKIDRASLLKYIISFRRHTEFHEHCVERIYADIQAQCAPKSLLVYARYTRRGGLDINPWRSSQRNHVATTRTPRQ